MDTFLQLVPMGHDADSDTGLVYGEDELVVGEPAVDLVDAMPPNEPVALFDDHATSSSAVTQEHLAPEGYGYVEEPEPPSVVQNEIDELERQRYAKRARTIEKNMQNAENEVQQRLNVMKLILELKDPIEQLSEYVALMLEERHDEEIEIVSELLQCARNLTQKEDIEVALFGAFFFLCDAAPRNRNRGMTAMLPVVAAMMEASNGLDHPF